MTASPLHLRGRLTHARRGGVRHAFGYQVDYLLVDPDSPGGPLLFSRNRRNLAALWDRDHGGTPGAGRGAAWAREALAAAGLPEGPGSRLRLLTQPRLFGTVFNPVSFWLRFEQEALVAVIAEVNNTFGDRHSYLCHRDGFAPIGVRDSIQMQKLFHVSPFQDIAGDYRFAFDVRPDRLSIRIVHHNGDEGLVATLTGPLAPLTNAALVRAAFRYPAGPFRVISLIHWHALRLWLKGVRYRPRPAPPAMEITR